MSNFHNKFLIILFASVFAITGGTPAQAESPSKDIVVSYSKSVPNFPKSVANYKLVIQEPYARLRVFQGDKKWSIPIQEFDPDQGGSATMSCDPFFWVLRWRSNNPDVQVKISRGITDFGFEPISKVKSGGAGYSSGYSCSIPAFKFSKTLKGNKSNLVDINFEYQIWEYKPRI
jgi:hypothetical protein